MKRLHVARRERIRKCPVCGNWYIARWSDMCIACGWEECLGEADTLQYSVLYAMGWAEEDIWAYMYKICKWNNGYDYEEGMLCTPMN